MSKFQVQYTSFVPIYHWRGARPWLVDLEPDQTGWLICLCLQREGDVSLLPLAWQVDALDEHDEGGSTQPYPTVHTDALESAPVSLTLADLQKDGWQINGRLTIQFTGRETERNFEENMHRFLWHSPGDSHGV